MIATTTTTTTTELLIWLIACAASFLAYPFVLRFATNHHIVDNPNIRKLQRVPVPVMGGAVVFVGMLIPVILFNIRLNDPIMWMGCISMIVMLVVGLVDDITDLSAVQRFIIEVVLIYGIYMIADIGIDSLHGLWNYWTIPANISLPLSVVAGVGIINSINLIDGVDGYSSGYCIMSSILFAVIAYYAGDVVMGRLGVICAGALFPFFLHNVFGLKSKMFIGDSGTLMLGMLMVMFVFSVLSRNSECCKLEPTGIGLVPFTLAVMSIPIFDTLRVMSVRIYRGVSPFHPDKTHLHHLFIDMGFSHIGATFSILSMNFLTVLVWFISWKRGATVDVQLYIVVGFSLLTTFFFYHFMRLQSRRGPKDENGEPMGTWLWRCFHKLGNFSHMERKGFWRFMRDLMDGTFWSKR